MRVYRPDLRPLLLYLYNSRQCHSLFQEKVVDGIDDAFVNSYNAVIMVLNSSVIYHLQKFNSEPLLARAPDQLLLGREAMPANPGTTKWDLWLPGIKRQMPPAYDTERILQHGRIYQNDVGLATPQLQKWQHVRMNLIRTRNFRSMQQVFISYP